MNIYSEYAIEHVTVNVRSMKKLQEKWRHNARRVVETCIDPSGLAESYIVVRQFRTVRVKKRADRYIEEVKFVYDPNKHRRTVTDSP